MKSLVKIYANACICIYFKRAEINPIEMIIVGTHLEPKRTQYHNCGIDDLHSGYGIIYDGNKWEHWRISQIMTLPLSKAQKQYPRILRMTSENKIE